MLPQYQPIPTKIPKSTTPKLVSQTQEAFQLFRPKSRPDIQVGIYLLKMEDLEPASHLLAERFHKHEVKYVHLDLPYEDVYTLMRAYVKRSIEDGLAVCAIDITNNKMAGVNTIMDTYREINEPLHLEKLFPKDAQMQKLLEYYDYFHLPKEMAPKGPGEFWGGGVSATDSEYEQMGILGRQMLLHRKIMPYGQATALAANFKSQSTTATNGAKLIKSIRLRDYKDKNGVKVFEGVEETLKKMGMGPNDEVQLMYWNVKKPTPKL